MNAMRLSQEIAQRVEDAVHLYHRLVIVVGPAQSGKTIALRELQETRGWPLININLALSEKLLELTSKQRALRVAMIVDEILQEHRTETIMLDNTELLFHPALKQDHALA